ncbi:MAG: DUF3810 domain-containing protein [Blastocatellia bacterium]|nr:DUF3810 domain-containing protein [Blastocatellia bacterium]
MLKLLIMETNQQIKDLANKKPKLTNKLTCWLIPLLFLTSAIFLQLSASSHPSLIEKYYHQIIYPYIAQFLSLINKLIWFSLAELILLVILIVLPSWLFWQIRKFYLKKSPAKELILSSLWKLSVFTSAGLLLFLFLWGLNYQKQPLAQNLNLPSRKVDTKELLEVCQAFIEATNESYREATPPTFYLASADKAFNNNLLTPKISHSQIPITWQKLNDNIERSFQKEPLLNYLAKGNYGPAKAVYLSTFMSRFGISGIFIPLTGEPNVNVAQVDCSIPFTLAHEKAHQRGFALEDEANFLALLICIKSEDSYSRYSGYLMATIHLLNTLYLVAPEHYQNTIEKLSSGPKTDLKAMSHFWNYYSGALSKVSEKVNHTYLKANRVQSGIKNYNEVVNLIISYYFIHLSSNAKKNNLSDYK